MLSLLGNKEITIRINYFIYDYSPKIQYITNIFR